MAGATLVLIAAGLGLLASRDVEQRLAVRGANAPLNPGATDPRDLRLHNSPTVVRSAVDARDLAVAARVDGPLYACSLNVSGDAGKTWREVAIPVPAGEEPKCYAPDAVFDSAGTLYLSYVTLRGRGNVPNATWVARMERGATSLSAPRRALGGLAFQVRLTADPRRAGRLWLTWLQADQVGLFQFTSTGNPIQSVRSLDGGATWSTPSRVSSPRRARVVAPSPVATRGGRHFVLYLDLGEDRLDYEGGHAGQGGPPYAGHWKLVLARSEDAGQTWEERVIDTQITPISRFVTFIPAFPSLVADQGGNTLYAAFHDARLGDADVWLWRSSDGGASWTRAQRVNDTRPRDGTAQYLPRLGLSPDGRIDVLYYDRRADLRDRFNEVSLQSARPGEGFSRRLRVSDRAFDSRVGDGRERDLPELGSRLGLLSSPSEALAVWPDTRAGAQVPRQDLARAVIAVTLRREPNPWLLVPAAGLGAAGGLLLGLGLARRRRS